MNAIAFVTKSLAATDCPVARAFAPTQILERELDAIDVWSRSVERADAATGPLTADAHFAIQQLKALRNPGPAEFVGLFSELFRALGKNRHVRQYRDAMAGCVDIVEDFAEMARQDLAEALVADPSDPDAYDRWRDDQRDEVRS